MRNITMTVEGDTLTMKVDLSVAGTVSKTGKSMILASTGGNVPVDGRPEVKVGLNIYRPR